MKTHISAALLLCLAACDDGTPETTDAAVDDMNPAADMAPLEDMAPIDDMTPAVDLDPIPDLGPPPPAPFDAAAVAGTWASLECEPSNGEFLYRQITLGETDYTIFATVFDDRACTTPLFSFEHHGTYAITGGSHLGEDIAQATFHLEQNIWTLHDPVFEMAFEINMCGSDMWTVDVPQDISATGCLQFAYPVDTCPDGERDLIRLADGTLTTGDRSVDLCAERAPALADFATTAMPDAVIIDAPLYHPEGVAIGPDRAVYTGSYTTGEIRRAPFGSATTDPLVEPGALGGAALGIKVHDDTLWVCMTNPEALDESALVALDPTTGDERARYPLPGGGICNDLAIAPDGAAYVTESSRNSILRLAPGADALTAWFTGDALPPVGALGFGFNGLVVTATGDLLVGRADDGTLTRIPILEDGPGDPTVEAVDPPITTIGIDGMATWRGRTYAVRDGRVVRLIPGDPWTTELIAEGDDFPATLAIDPLGNAWTTEARFGPLLDGDDTTHAEPPFRVVRHPLH